MSFGARWLASAFDQRKVDNQPNDRASFTTAARNGEICD
jgi:hypothetical protein